MPTRWIVVKNIMYYESQGFTHTNDSVVGTHSAKMLGINTVAYDRRADADADCARLNEFNPCGYYGVLAYSENADEANVDSSL